ncbi:MAG: T9SS type A sorting domain-containing protein [Dysgonamonadaceae bacterium]|jgi:YD repeat-containing protein|nr:T9SS type A sorting domain-containing protein [Dysgonamonadaceae bacterium]
MNKKVLYLTVISCLVLAGQVWAGNPVYLPTVGYRNNGEEKVEYTYDTYGHVLSIKDYRNNGEGKYEPSIIYSYQYHRLPNGLFTITKNEFLDEWSGNREVSAYDSKGMQLYIRQETYNSDVQQWKVRSGIRAEVNNNGIRTGIECYNDTTGVWQHDSHYTFDSKGRVIQVVEVEEAASSGASQSKNLRAPFSLPKKASGLQAANTITETWMITYTWNDNNQLTEASVQLINGADVATSVTYRNITTVLNGEYFNAYSLYPMDNTFNFSRLGDDVPNYAWEDYESYQWCFNAEIVRTGNAEGIVGLDIDEGLEDGTYIYTTTVVPAQGEMTQTITREGIEYWKGVFKKGANGSWSSTLTSDDRITEHIREYNVYGALTRNYYHSTELNYNYSSEYEDFYIREYNAVGRPTKTTFWCMQSSSGSNDYSKTVTQVYEETYEAWTNFTPTSMAEAPAGRSLSVYPNPAGDYITIDNVPAGSELTISDGSGRVVFRQANAKNKATVSVASLAKGLYIVTVQNRNERVVAKIVKK